ncbi:MAG: SDR family oxidoreductase [Pseudomonadales bacterium]|nr:SDR family oxidoreductase [Pseudomonadales bacterium]NRA17944.1 SDR family oxidoreductase [Oceanospirillaceae bacterium]
MNLFDLSDKVALITGASSGIGAQQAKALSAAGASVVLLGRREQKLAALKLEIEAKGGWASTVVADLADFSNLDDIANACLQPYQQIDILCNTAGINMRQHADQLTVESWDETLQLNLKVPFFLAQKLVPQMFSRGWGKIINVASLQSQRAFNNGIAYGASKGGIVQLTRAMAEAWSSRGVSCNAIAPGFFPTELTQTVFEQGDLTAKLSQQTAIGRNGELQDLDGLCVFLASHGSDYITGQTIYIDGGFTAK